jgi:transglycosylase-like protein with SLT domain
VLPASLPRAAKRALRRLKRAVGWSRRPRLRRAAWGALVLALLAAANAAVQVARKPTELLGVVAPTRARTPEETWAAYRPLFEAHATAAIDAPLLAALAQVESAGDPLARTYWRWQWSLDPLEVYAPASSAVGLLQITDGTFEQARRLCIDGHAVVRPGRDGDRRACGLLGAYFRTVPGHAIELTSAWLDDSVADALARARRPRAPPEARRRLAAVIHLCGRERGVAYARRGFWAMPGERCGDHDLARYVARVAELRAAFARMGPPAPR